MPDTGLLRVDGIFADYAGPDPMLAHKTTLGVDGVFADYERDSAI